MVQDEIYEEVVRLLSDKVGEVFLAMQEKMGITNGDDPIDQAINRTTVMEKLAADITVTLMWQKTCC